MLKSSKAIKVRIIQGTMNNYSISMTTSSIKDSRGIGMIIAAWIQLFLLNLRDIRIIILKGDLIKRDQIASWKSIEENREISNHRGNNIDNQDMNRSKTLIFHIKGIITSKEIIILTAKEEEKNIMQITNMILEKGKGTCHKRWLNQ